VNGIAQYVGRRTQRFEHVYGAGEWLRYLMELGVKAATASRWAQPFAEEVQPARFSAGMADLRLFLVTFLHETGMLERMEENLSYSAERLMAVWPSRFPTLAAAEPFARNPEALANKVYGGRMGNTQPGDGWTFRGRAGGITGRTNYDWLGDKMGQDLLVNPDLLLQPRYALEGSFYVWEGLVPDRHLSDQVKVRKIYNGGLIGLEHCSALNDLACKVLA